MSQVQSSNATVDCLAEAATMTPVSVTNTENGIVIQIAEEIDKDDEEEEDFVESADGDDNVMKEGIENDTSAPDERLFFDNKIWCNDCGDLIKGLKCKIHGDLTHIRDRGIPCRAKLTAPHLVSIRTLEYLPGGHDKMGVFARKVIQKRTEFGPYEGLPQATWKYGLTGGTDRLMLKIFSSQGSSTVIDCTDESMCNWMMYIRPAKTFDEQNLVAYQYKGAIYYATIKAIPPNAELRVWYAKPYARVMGVDVLSPTGEDVNQEFVTGYHNISTEEIAVDDDNGDADDADYVAVPEVRPVKPSSRPVRTARRSVLDSTSEDHRRCPLCDKIFESLAELQAHMCEEYEHGKEPQEEGFLKGRNRRKGNPCKLLKEEDKDPSQQPTKRRGRPPKYLLGDTNSKAGVKSRSTVRAKGSIKALLKAGKRRPLKVSAPRVLHQCDICARAFLNESKLKMHMYSHSGEKPFRCSFKNCDKAFTSKFKVMRHELIHTSEKQHACMYCHKNFSRKDHLKHHLRVHDPNKSMHQCCECGKMYASPYAYRTHLAHHAAERGELTCQVCKEDFTQKEDLMKHLKAHAGARSIKDSTEKRQKCLYCDKKFFTLKDVKRHMIVHTKDRNHLCQYCPQKFGRRDHLIRHQKKSHIMNPVTGEISNLGNSPKNKIKLSPTKSHELATETVDIQKSSLQHQQPQVTQPTVMQQPQETHDQTHQQAAVQQEAHSLQHAQVQPVEAVDQPRLMDSAMISKLLQSVARGILDPNISAEESPPQQVVQQDMPTVVQSTNSTPRALIERQLLQQIKRKRPTVSVNQRRENTTQLNTQGIITSMGNVPAQYLHYQTTVAPTPATNQQIVNLVPGSVSSQSTVSRSESIANIAQQLAEPTLSGHFVPPFVSQSQVEQPISSPQIQVQQIQSMPSHAMLQQQQQQIIQTQAQVQLQQSQQPQQQESQQQSQQPIALQASLLNSNQTVLMGNIHQGVLADSSMRLPILNSQMLTSASPGPDGDQPFSLTMRQGMRPIQMVQLPNQPGQTKQMLVVTPIAPNTSIGNTTVSAQSVTQYTESIKLLLNQLSLQQRGQTQGQPSSQQLP